MPWVRPGTALADFSQLLAVGKDDLSRLLQLVAEGSVAQVGGGHAKVDPAAGLGLSLRHVRIDVAAHVGEEGDDIVVGHGLDGVDLLLLEGGMVADPLGLLLGDANLAKLGLRLASQHLDLLPDGVLVLEREDVTNLGAGVAIDHANSFRPNVRRSQF